LWTAIVGSKITGCPVHGAHAVFPVCTVLQEGSELIDIKTTLSKTTSHIINSQQNTFNIEW